MARQTIAKWLGKKAAALPPLSDTLLPAKSAPALRERIPANYRCRAARRDCWLPSAEVFPWRTHRLCDKSEGQTCYVERWNHTLRQRPRPCRLIEAPEMGPD